MDFHQLLAKMAELDTPSQPTTVAPVESITQECGQPMGMTPPMGMSPAREVPPPSLSINLNAQGMDDIESIMKLMTKVNPDMINQKGPDASMLNAPPSVASISSLGNLDSGPLKMLPDFDADNDDMPGGEMDIEIGGDDAEPAMLPEPIDMDGEEDSEDNMSVAQGDIDNDGDHDMDDHEAEEEPAPGEEDNKEEAWDNEPDETEKSIDYMNNTLAGGMNRPKGTYPKVAGGDNPMQRQNESGDYRAAIRAELLQRLAEAKGAK